MKFVKIQKITKSNQDTSDITVKNNHNFFANNHLIHNCFYSGEVHIDLHNVGLHEFRLVPNMKVAQLIIVPMLYGEPVECPEEDLYASMKQEEHRDAGGFGSTNQ